MRLKICVLTAARSEYGLLRPLLHLIQNDQELELQLICIGAHLSLDFGKTESEITADGIAITRRIETLLSSETQVGIAKSLGLTIIGCAEAFAELMPDLLIVLGDRAELVPVVQAARLAHVPVAHLSGGEKTEGSLDECFRHAVTKMANIHFTALPEYTKRLLQLGESPHSVYEVGELGLDNIKLIERLPRERLETELGLKFLSQNLLVSFHPETTRSLEDNLTSLGCLLECLDQLTNTLVIATGANSDFGGREFNNALRGFCDKSAMTRYFFPSLGTRLYYSCVDQADAVVGNSSSGVVEVPSFGVPSLNIGDRQKGRVMAKSTLSVAATVDQIDYGLKVVTSEEFRLASRSVDNPYHKENCAERMIEIIKGLDFAALSNKEFRDVQF